MSAVHPSAVTATRPALRTWWWWPVALGWVALFGPTYVHAFATTWSQEAYEHGPLILGLVGWLIWRQRDALAALADAPAPALAERATGAVLIAAGLAAWYLGRALNLALFEIGAHVPIACGLVLALGGWRAMRVLWFALLFLIFIVPLPPFVILAITGQLKAQVSMLAESLLYAAGYPVARDGVTITVGQYRMLVADACAGLNSIYSLSAMGLLYLYITPRRPWGQVVALLACIVPVAFIANVIRVIALILITWYFGDEAGQGFLHGAAGVVLFGAALLGLFAIDAVLTRTRALVIAPSKVVRRGAR